jgi:hypothetical protein
VERLDHGSEAELTILADSEVPDGRSFYGWAVVSVAAASGRGRRVESTPRAGNCFHADIWLPDDALENYDERVQHAKELASYASGRSRFKS